jgi:hypothetical protein
MKSLEAPVRMVHRSRGNALWPLPPDYHELSEGGKRMARTNACMQYLLPWGPQTDYKMALHRQGLVFVDCLNFFDQWYLRPAENFDPLFYDAISDPADIHFQISYEAFTNKSLLQILPRGLAKTTRKKIEILLKMYTKLGHKLVYTTSSHAVAENVGESLRSQISLNTRLLDDFGALAPRKGQGSYNSHRVKLVNGYVGMFTSIDSKQRGFRPLEYVLDDVEADAKTSTDMEKVREELDVRINKVVKPMLQLPGARFHMMATPISNQHLATRIAADILGLQTDPQMADHPSQEWKRTSHPIVTPEGRSIWPSMYPTDDEEKAALGLHPEAQTLAQIRKDVGEAAWWSEYMLQPGRAASGFFKVDPEFGTYRVRGRWPGEHEDPLKSDAVLIWKRKQDDTVVERPLADIVRSGSCFMTVDTSYGHGPTSDYKVWHVLVRTHQGDILSLDMAAMRVRNPTFIRDILEAGSRWRCHTVFPEYVVSQREFCQSLENAVAEGVTRSMRLAHTPRIKRLSVHNEPKASRIQSLGLWFDEGLVKLPVERMHDPVGLAYPMLRRQIEGFNPQAQDGGLSNDDCIDTLAAAIKTPKSFLAEADMQASGNDWDAILDAWAQGENFWHERRIAEFVPFEMLTGRLAEREENLRGRSESTQTVA